MNPLKEQNLSDKGHVHSETAEKQSILPVTDNEEQINTNVVEEQASKSLKMNKLNHDCLAKVLIHLSVLDRLEMEKVCQKWKEATQMSSYKFKKINFDNLKITLDKKEETWKMIFEKYGRYLKDLTISYKYPWICNIIQNECPNITRLDIDMSVLGEYDEYPFLVFHQTISRIPKLKYFKITINSDKSPDFFTRLLELIPADMEEIHLLPPEHDEFTPIVWKPSISVVPDKFKNLRCLTLQGFDLDQSIMELISLNSNTLVHLDLTRCNSTPNVSVFSNFNNLEYLSLNKIKNINVDIITAISRNCPKLNHLEWCSLNDDNNTWQVVPSRNFIELKYLKNLEYLRLTEIERSNDDESIVSNIANNCKQLKYLALNFPLSISEANEIAKLKNLEYLQLLDREIEPETLTHLANYCLELRDLNMMFDDNYVSDSIEELKNLKKLEILEFYECFDLTGDVLIKIVSACKNLKYLMVKKCEELTEESLIQIAKLEFLEVLIFDHNDVNVPIGMFDYFHNLRSLSCRNYPTITDECIIKVIDNCQNLSYLYLDGTSVTVETLIHASKRKLIFQVLKIQISASVKINNHQRNAIKSPYLKINFV